MFFFKQKQTQVRRGILPGNSKSLWDSVKIAKGINIPSLLDNMSLNDNLIKNNDLPEAFANFFENKITQITSNTQISNNVYNRTKKVDHPNSFFMTDTDIRECRNNIKIKNCEGYDRIPKRILVDSANILAEPLRQLFKRVYFQNSIPEQWLISKIIPIHKKAHQIKLKITDQLLTFVLPQKSSKN